MCELIAVVGLGLIIMGGAAGVGLLLKAFSFSAAEIRNKDTLWGLFIIGMTV